MLRTVTIYSLRKRKVESLSHVRLFATPWTIAYQAPPSMGFSRQQCWSGLPFPSPGDLPNPGIEPQSPALWADALPSEPPEKPGWELMLRTFTIYSLSNFQKCNTVLLTIVTMLYIETLPMTYLFYNCKFVPFDLLCPSGPPPHLHLWQPICSLYLWVCFFFLFLRFHKWYHIVFIFFVWLISLSIEIPWRKARQPTPVFLPGESPRTEEPGRL